MASDEKVAGTASPHKRASAAFQVPFTDIPDIYSEGVTLQMGFNSIGLLFNRTFAETPNTMPIAKIVGTVRMSPQQAKVLAIVLANAIEQYENRFGVMAIPTDILKQLGAEDEEEQA